MIERFIGDLLRKFGIKLILRELVKVLNRFRDRHMRHLADDIEKAVNKYERREKKSSGIKIKIGDMLIKAIKRWGVQAVMREIINWLDKSDDDNLLELARDLYSALQKYERDTK